MLRFFPIPLLAMFFLCRGLVAEEPAEELPKQTLASFPEPFPAELAEEVFQRSIVRRDHFPYESKVKTQAGDVSKADLIWKKQDTFNNTFIREVELGFESERVKDSKRAKFNVFVRYDEERVVVRHSRPVGRDFTNGIKVPYSTRTQSNWGGFLYGDQVPGVVFIVSRFVETEPPPIFICPRFALRKNWQFVIQGRDPKSALISVHGKAKGDVLAHFYTGFSAGSVALRFQGYRVPANFESERFVVMEDARVPFEYIPLVDSLQGSPIAETREGEKGVHPVALATTFHLKNAAGYEKSVLSTKSVWIQEVPIKRSQPITVMQDGVPMKVDLRAGLCVLLLPMDYERVTYRGVGEEEAE